MVEFSPLKRRKVEAEFSGGEITSDAGVVLLREVDRKLGLMKQVANVSEDSRRQDLVQHSLLQHPGYLFFILKNETVLFNHYIASQIEENRSSSIEIS
jgi:hypothetical protein